jgi:hypothetical protein
MRIALKVEYVDGSGVDVIASAPDFIAYERKFNRSIVRIGDEARFEDLCFLAWASLSRRKQTAEDFDEWINRLETVGYGAEEDADIVPLENTPSTG